MSLGMMLLLMLVVSLVTMAIIFICCYLLNPEFWQGYRNSRFYDELKQADIEEAKKMIEP